MRERDVKILDHLEDLRKGLIISAITFIIFLVLAFIYVKHIYLFVMGNVHYKLLVLGPSDVIRVYFQLSAIVALAATLPVAFWQIWLLIKPSLPPRERKMIISYIPALFVLFISGISFGYFFVFPNILRFLTSLGKDMMETSFTVDKYFSFLLNITLPFGIAFEMPLVMMFLTSLGIVNPYMVAKLRKYAYFILVIIASMISPPEFISHISVAIPLILIYEVSVLLSKMVYKRKQKNSVAIEKVEELYPLNN